MNSQICFELLQNKDKLFLNYIFENNFDWLINLGFYIVNRSFPNLLIEKNELMFIAYKSCQYLCKVKIDSLQKYGIKYLIKYIMVQKIIEWTRKLNNKKNYIISNYINIDSDYINLNNTINCSYSNECEIINNIFKIEIINKVTSKIKNNNDLKLLNIYKQYFLLNYSVSEISKINNLDPKTVLKYINKTKNIIKNINVEKLI